MSHKLITAVFAILSKDDQILLVNNVDLSFVSRWTLPGGKVEEGETLYEALVREVREETDYHIKEANIAYVHEAFFPHHLAHVRAIIFHVTKTSEFEELKAQDPSGSVIHSRFVSLSQLGEFITHKEMLQALENWLTQRSSCNYIFTPNMEW